MEPIKKLERKITRGLSFIKSIQILLLLLFIIIIITIVIIINIIIIIIVIFTTPTTPHRTKLYDRSPGEEIPMRHDGDARRNFQKQPQKVTNLDVTLAYFDP